VFVDNDLSAYSGKRRPRYRDLLRAVEEKAVDVIVAWHNDRLHRSPAELEQFIPVCEAAGVTVHTVKAGLVDLSTPAGRMMARQFGSIARYESEHRSERVKSRHAQIAAQCGWSGGGCRPYGYESPKRTENGGRTPWRLREEEAAVLRDATRRVLAGESARSVAADLNERGIRTVTGGRWLSESLRSVLYSPRIAGQRWHHGQIMGKADWPAIITPADSARLRQLLGPRVPKTGTGRGRPPWLLTRILKCGRCGRPMKSGSAQIYSCRSDLVGGCLLSINKKRTDTLVRDAVLAAIDMPSLRLATTALASQADEDHDDQEAIDQAKADLRALGQRVAAGRMKVWAYEAAAEPLESRIEELEQRLARRVGGYALADVLGDKETLRARWDDLSMDRQRAVITALVDRIVVGPAVRGPYNPDRLQIIWKWTAEADAAMEEAA